MFNKLKAEDFKGIVSLLEEREGLEVEIRELFGGKLSLSNVDDEGELDIYIRPFPEYTLTVARISLNKKRCGIGTAILSELIEYCKKNNISKIVMESVMTKEMINFCNKNKFKIVPSSAYREVYGNYELVINHE